MLPTEDRRPSSGVAAAGGIGAVVACCTVKLLVITGLVAGFSGAAIGGLAVGAGILAAFASWLVLMLVRRRKTRKACDTATSAGSRTLARQGRDQ